MMSQRRISGDCYDAASFVTYATWGLFGHEQQKRGAFGSYELLAMCDDAQWCSNVLTQTGRLSLQELFEPGDTLDMGLRLQSGALGGASLSGSFRADRSCCYVSMPAEHQPVVHAAGLMVFEGGQVGESGGFGLVEDGFGHCLQGAPAEPVQFRGMGDLSQETAPFDDDAVDIARAEQAGDPGLFGEGILVDGCDDLLGPGAVFGRRAIFEVAGDGLQAIPLVANDSQLPAPAVDVLAGEAKPGVQVGEVVD